MSQYRFKAGDKVRRIGSSFNCCRLGEIYTVELINRFKNKKGHTRDGEFCAIIELEEIHGAYFSSNFELVEESTKYPNPPHVHAELIKAWADGATIQFYSKFSGRYVDINNNKPYWDEKEKYRIKPDLNKDHIQDKIESLLSEVKELKKQLEEI